MASSERPRVRPFLDSDPSELRPARILVADDDRLARELLAGLLRNAGHSVETAEDGQEAVDRITQGGVDLVLLDVVMPRLSGLEACRLLKAMTLEGFLPVVLVTVKTDSASRADGLRVGADDYVCKPFEEQELLARVASMLRVKKLHDQVASQKARFERLSVHDEMTGLYNYRYLHTRLSEEFKRAERYHEPFACVLVDIDQLRAVNEVAGRNAGDAVIRRVCEGIKTCVRDVDVVARYGGEEFLIVLPSTHFAGSVVVAERIWREVSGRPIELDRNERGERRSDAPPSTARTWDPLPPAGEAKWAIGSREITVSIGVALYPSRDVRTKDALIRAADAALAQAKREGGNRICVFQQQGYIYTPSVGGASRPSQEPAEEGAFGARPSINEGAFAKPAAQPASSRGNALLSAGFGATPRGRAALVAAAAAAAAAEPWPAASGDETASSPASNDAAPSTRRGVAPGTGRRGG